MWLASKAPKYFAWISSPCRCTWFLLYVVFPFFLMMTVDAFIGKFVAMSCVDQITWYWGADNWSPTVHKHVSLRGERPIRRRVQGSVSWSHRGRLANTGSGGTERHCLGCGEEGFHPLAGCVLPWPAPQAWTRPLLPRPEVDPGCTCTCISGCFTLQILNTSVQAMSLPFISVFTLKCFALNNETSFIQLISLVHSNRPKVLHCRVNSKKQRMRTLKQAR